MSSTGVKRRVTLENRRPMPSIPPVPSRLRVLVPPINFGAVETGKVYRSAYPTLANYDFITSLRIKTIMYEFRTVGLSTC